MPVPLTSTPAPLLALGQRWEKLGLILPRSLLNWAEIHATPNLISDAEINQCLAYWRSRKVALVRQTAYRGAYLPDPSQNWVNIVLSARAHLGPMSFLAELQADYFVVRQAPDPETHLWRKNIAHDIDPQASLREVQAWQAEQESKGVVDCEKVRWSDYDLVICMDIPIPTRIVSKTTKTIWAYYSVEAGGFLHKKSISKPMAGYHLYLNHCFRRYRTRPFNRRHMLEFPFTFQSAKTWESLANSTLSSGRPRHGALVDRASWKSSPAEKPSFMTPLSGKTPIYIQLMTSHQFAIRTAPEIRWGNWAIESIQAGCLFLGRAESLAMPGILLPELIAPDLATAQRTIESLLKNPLRMKVLAQTQAALTEHLAFRRPLVDLTNHAKAFFKA